MSVKALWCSILGNIKVWHYTTCLENQSSEISVQKQILRGGKDKCAHTHDVLVKSTGVAKHFWSSSSNHPIDRALWCELLHKQDVQKLLQKEEKISNNLFKIFSFNWNSDFVDSRFTLKRVTEKSDHWVHFSLENWSEIIQRENS